MARKRRNRSSDDPVKPPVIDLEATEVTDADAAEAEQPETLSGDSSSGGAEVEATPQHGIEPPVPGEGTDTAQEGVATGEAHVSPDESDGAREGESVAGADEEAAVPSRRSGRAFAIAAVVLGLLVTAAAGAWLYREYGAGSVESSATATQMKALEARLEVLEAAQSVTANDVQAIAADAKMLQDSLKDMEVKAGHSASAIAELKSNLTSAISPGAAAGDDQAAGALQIGALAGDMEDIQKRVKNLEDDLVVTRDAVAGLTSKIEGLDRGAPAATDASKAASLATAFSELESRIAEGKPFVQEVDALAALDPNLPGLTDLRSVAQEGVASADDLAHQLDAAIAKVAATNVADQSPADQGWMAGLKSRLFSVVKIRKIGDIDWREAGAKAQRQLARGDLGDAIATLGPASARTPQPIASWLVAAERRRQALERLAGLSAAVFQSIRRSPS